MPVLTTDPTPLHDEDDLSSPTADKFDILSSYRQHLASADVPMPIAAILALADLVEASEAETLHHLVISLRRASKTLQDSVQNPVSLTAGADTYLRFVTREASDFSDFAQHKAHLVQLSRSFASSVVPASRSKIAASVQGFIRPDAVVLTHSYSRVVMQALLAAHEQHRRVRVYVTEGRPGGLGLKTYRELTAAGVPCTVLLDSAVAYLMERVDVCLVGSEAVVESGGIINAVGSYQLALIAKAHSKPFFALAESYKFLRLFPLSQTDLPSSSSQSPLPLPTLPSPSTSSTSPENGNENENGKKNGKELTPEQLALNPAVDYTTPELITLVFSDIGILTSEGVSQHLVQVFAD